ncbi:hypothetical protein [Granulicella paludicola]|uniref:hypothetical protein n=1 Tax=Granulicella paludicola TaxID=474951 RepID=UPI0021DF5FFD|nr:hypothetical protein [Granulicella paludicola]
MVEEILPQEFIATTEGGDWGGYLSVWLDPHSGEGSWNQIAPEDKCEPWRMSPDGIASISGEQVSVHGLAERFATKLITKR